jgi:hypothetical protein
MASRERDYQTIWDRLSHGYMDGRNENLNIEQGTPNIECRVAVP